MKQYIILLLTIHLAVATLAQAPAGQWQSKNSTYLDDMPFDDDGKCIFTIVIEVPGVSAADLYTLLTYGFIPVTRQDSINPTGKNFKSVELFTYGAGAGTDVSVSFTDAFQAKDGRFKYSFEITNIWTRHLGKDNKFVRKEFGTLYFSKKDFSGHPHSERTKELVTNIVNDRIAALKSKDYVGLILKGKHVSQEEKEGDWKSNVSELPNSLPFCEFVDFENLTGDHYLVYRGFVKTGAPLKEVQKALTVFANTPPTADKFGVLRFKQEPRIDKTDFSIAYAFEPVTGGYRYFMEVYNISLPHHLVPFSGTPEAFFRKMGGKTTAETVEMLNGYFDGKLTEFTTKLKGVKLKDDW